MCIMLAIDTRLPRRFCFGIFIRENGENGIGRGELTKLIRMWIDLCGDTDWAVAKFGLLLGHPLFYLKS